MSIVACSIINYSGLS